MRRLYCILSALGFLSLSVAADSVSGQLAVKGKLEDPPGPHSIDSYAFSPDGKTLAGGEGVMETWPGGGRVVLWDLTTYRLLNPLGGHGAAVTWLAYSRDGRLLASASKENGLVRLWDLKRGTPGPTIQLQGKCAYHRQGKGAYLGRGWPLLLLSADGKTLVTADIYCRINGHKELIELKSGKGIFPEHIYQVATQKLLLEENDYRVDRCRVLNIPRSEDESFREHILTDKEVKTGQEIFLHCLAIYYLKKEVKNA